MNNLSIDESEDEMNFLHKKEDKNNKPIAIVEIGDQPIKKVERSLNEKEEEKEEDEINFLKTIPNWKNLPKNLKIEIKKRIQFQQFESENFELKKILRREIKLPNNDSNSIQNFSKNLNLIKGNLSQKRKFIQNLNEDVKYFKKKKLEIQIDKFSEKELK